MLGLFSTLFNLIMNRCSEERKRIMAYQIGADNAMEVFDVNYFFGKKKVVNGFSFKFKRNKIYAILGAPGSGKSTLASHFNGLLKSNTANIYLFNGQNIYRFNKKIPNFREIRKTVGMILQNPEHQLFKEVVLDDVCCGLEMLQVEGFDRKQKAKEKLLELGIGEEFFDRNPLMLSGGQKKKVALAGILVIEPDIIIFDEPILGLDPYSSKKIVEMIEGLKRSGRTIIVISNNMDLLLELSDEMILMDRGHLLAHGKPYTIFRDKRIDLGVPKIIQFIENLTEKSKAFERVWEDEPKNYLELSRSLVNVLRE